MTDEELLDQRLLESRTKKFAVKIEAARRGCLKNEFLLSTTTNGYQWRSLSLLPYEAESVILALQKYCAEHP